MSQRRPVKHALVLALLLLFAIAASSPAAEDDSAADPEQAASPASTEEQPEPEADADRRSATEGRAAGDGRRRFGSRTLKIGMEGSDVRGLQRRLNKLGFRAAKTGYFGERTRETVKRYERWREPKVNGAVGRRQAKNMNRLIRKDRRYRGHVFPVRGTHNYGGAGSRFGAPRGGRAHQGQDVAAAEGTKMVAVHEGRVSTVQYQAGGAGHYLVIRGRDGADSVYMHLQQRPRVEVGERVMAGQPIGRVGNTGASTGPHLHFELWTPHWFAGGSAYDPLPKLMKWDRRR